MRNPCFTSGMMTIVLFLPSLPALGGLMGDMKFPWEEYYYDKNSHKMILGRDPTGGVSYRMAQGPANIQRKSPNAQQYTTITFLADRLQYQVPNTTTWQDTPWFEPWAANQFIENTSEAWEGFKIYQAFQAYHKEFGEQDYEEAYVKYYAKQGRNKSKWKRFKAVKAAADWIEKHLKKSIKLPK